MTDGYFRMDYGTKIEREIANLLETFQQAQFNPAGYPPRWLALKLLEGDAEILSKIASMDKSDLVLASARQSAEKLKDMLGDDLDLLAADRRYSYINAVVRQSVQLQQNDQPSLTDRIDNIVTHKWLGLPIFFIIMYLVFRLVIDVSSPFLDWTDAVINGPIARWISTLMEYIHLPGWLHSLAIGGIVTGVGGVLVFVPGLLMLYFFLALLEDSGYMSRAAFVMDRFMRVIGLHGKSFIPMILGFGCAVPAVYATRTIASRRDRILTALLIPLMSCSARLPVYVVFGLAFFGSRAGTVIWALYALGIVVAMLAGMLFTRTILKPDVSSAFVLELPPYRRPALKSVLIHMWENTSEFVHKAGTFILGTSVVLWLLLNLPWGVTNQQNSYFGKISTAIAPVFAPLGFGTWQSSGALLTGFMAKEVVVSTMSQVYLNVTDEQAPLIATNLQNDLLEIGNGFTQAVIHSARIMAGIIPGLHLQEQTAETEDTALSLALGKNFTPLSAISFLIFVLLYVPCVSTLGAIQHEFGTSWSITSAVYQTAIAWLVALLVYQIGSLLGLA